MIPLVVRASASTRERIAIGGISMGGFGAFDIALITRACSAPSAATRRRSGSRRRNRAGRLRRRGRLRTNDVVGTVQEDPEAFGDAHVWIDYGSRRPFRVYDEGFVEAMEAGSADFTAHSWPGAHEGGYWNDHWPDYQRFYVNSLAHCG